ncbi:MAG: hypothetical protein QW156_03920 [Candidatus Aenigmatarchaeota archaeon]
MNILRVLSEKYNVPPHEVIKWSLKDVILDLRVLTYENEKEKVKIDI